MKGSESFFERSKASQLEGQADHAESQRKVAGINRNAQKTVSQQKGWTGSLIEYLVEQLVAQVGE